MRSKTITFVPVLVMALVVMAIPTAAWASHEAPGEGPPMPLDVFREAVGSWLDPWLNETPPDIMDDHAPLLAFALYEELLRITPMTCYWDTYAAYWAVSAGLRALGQAPTREQQAVEFERVFEDIARADAIAELSAVHCLTWGTDIDDMVELDTTPAPAQDPGEETSPSRVIEIEATAALQFNDRTGNLLQEIVVTPGETVVFRVHNAAGFDHSFYIGSEEQLKEPGGVTDIGIEAWSTGVHEVEWRVPDDVSALLFGCTVPGHFHSMHGTFEVTPPERDTSSD